MRGVGLNFDWDKECLVAHDVGIGWFAARTSTRKKSWRRVARSGSFGFGMLPSMKRYAALLRGVSPMNAKMGELVAACEAEGFEDVRTVLASGNLVFSARSASLAAVRKRVTAAVARAGKDFLIFVRPIEALRALLESDPYAGFRLQRSAKRVVTFLLEPPPKKPALPVDLHGARILCVRGSEAFSAYVTGPRGPVFMTLIEKTFGKDVTTRTWDSVVKIVTVGERSS